MASSSTDIANYALAKLGSKRIQDINDSNSKGARLALLHYDQARKSLLRRHRWNFATLRAALTQDADAPAWGYKYQYAVPADFIRLMVVNNQDVWESGRADWFELEGSDTGRRILINSESVRIKYVGDVNNTNHFDDLFIEALSLFLAAKMARAMTGSDRKEQLLLEELEGTVLPDAMQTNASEAHIGENPPVIDAIQNSYLVRARGSRHADEWPEGPDGGTYGLPTA